MKTSNDYRFIGNFVINVLKVCMHCSGGKELIEKEKKDERNEGICGQCNN